MNATTMRFGGGLAAALVLTACGSDATGPTFGTGSESPVIDPGDGGDYDPDIAPGDFVTGIDNPYLPFRPGSRWTYESSTDEGLERIEVVVTDRTKQVMGVAAVVVHDTVTLDGELVEDTYDWYAQDRDGNVWYLGENTHEYENGTPVSSAGAWQAGVDGARPGIAMPAHPKVGMAYRQEYLPGEAEDMGEVVRVGDSTTVPAGRFSDLVVTRDWTPLEPDIVEQKMYAPGVGVVAEHGHGERVVLVAYRPGPTPWPSRS
jgi:hypothetical protein